MEKHPIVTSCGITNSIRGPVILIMNQYVHAGKSTSIHSSPQMEGYSIKIDDKSVKVGGTQCLTTLYGLAIERTEYCIERIEHCIASIIKLGCASCSYALAGIHDDFTVIPNTVPFMVPSLTTDTSITTSINPMFIATFANASMNHVTVGDYSPMSSMSPTVQVSDEVSDDESENFCVALTLDMLDVLTTDCHSQD